MSEDVKVNLDDQPNFHQKCPKCRHVPYRVDVECKIGPDYLKFKHKIPDCGFEFDIPRRDLKTFEGLTYIEIWDRWVNRDKQTEDNTLNSAKDQIRVHLAKIMQILDGLRTPT